MKTIAKISEYDIQCAVVEFLEMQYPEVKFTISPITKLTIPQAVRQKKLGYRSGSPDLIIFAARNSFNGLTIEFKSDGGRLSTTQKEWKEYLINEGYKYSCCFTIEEGISVIKEYFK